MSRGGRSHHLKWCHIGTKTEQLSGGNNNRIRLHILHFFSFFALQDKQLIGKKLSMRIFY